MECLSVAEKVNVLLLSLQPLVVMVTDSDWSLPTEGASALLALILLTFRTNR